MDLFILFLLILLNGVFALSEMAIVSSRRPRLKAMVDRGVPGSRTALRLFDDPSKLLSTAQTGITLIGVIAGAFGATTLAREFTPTVIKIAPSLTAYAPAIAFGVVIVATTFLSLLLGELVPKRVALAAPEPLAVAMAPLMAVTERVASPLVWFLRASTEGVVTLLGLNRTRQQDVTEEELQSLIEEGAKSGLIESEEREMIEGVMRLGDRNVKAIMTPRTDMVWLEVGAQKDDIIRTLRDSRHSRLPIVEDDFGAVVGVVQAKELLLHLASTGDLDLRAVMHAPVFVPETMSVLKLLNSLRGNPVRMAIVADEYGGVLGLVTAADLLELIAGDVALDVDESLTPPVHRGDGSWLIDGMTPIDEFERVVGERGLAGDDYATAAGLVLHLLRTVPREGDAVAAGNLIIEVVDMDGRRIDKLLVRRMEGGENPTG